jgi:mono/diheme cytochrome c family protein
MRFRRHRLLPAVLAPLALLVAGCGEQGIQIAESDPANVEGAQIFYEHCAACHTLTPAGAEGSSTRVNDREYKDGPNFNQRKEKLDQILYAIRNGGFSSGPMPQNIVVGEEAQKVARFVEKYSGNASAGKTQAGNPGNAPAEGVR